MNEKKFAIILAGNGVYDGAEIHESTLTMYSIAKNGATYQIFAPDKQQHHVVNHITGEEMNETRNVMVEAARIARGNIKPLTEYNAKDFDALIMPGGFGVAKNLCTFAFDGINCTVDPQVEQAIKATVELNKPVGALCISPVVIAKVLGNVELTIGQDADTAKAVEQFGATHKQTGHGEVVVDTVNKVVTTPCYMLDASIAHIGEGAENVVKAMLEMM